MFPSGLMLNLAVPVAGVLIDGERFWPDKLAVKLGCCANVGIDIDIRDRTKMPRGKTEVYLPIEKVADFFIFIDIHHFNRDQSIRYLLNFVKVT
jgi:hypothetical protein